MSPTCFIFHFVSPQNNGGVRKSLINFYVYFPGTRNDKSVPTVYNGNGTQFSVPFPLYTVGTLLPFLVPDIFDVSWDKMR